MAKIFDIAFRLGAELTANFQNAFNSAENSMSGLAKAADKLNSVGKSLSIGVTAPLVGLGAAAVKIGSDFDFQMSKVAAVSGATGEAFNVLRQQAQDLGASTKFTATQAAEGQEKLALAGWKYQNILSAMPGMLNLAAAGSLELSSAADITSDVMSAFGMAATEAGHAADVFAYAQANANTNVEQAGEAMKYLAPLANQMGWSMEESAAAIMKLADNGLKGTIAGQAFATSIARLAKPTKAMNKTMNKLGLSFFDAQGNMKSLPNVVKELEIGFEGLTMEQRSAAISTIFGAEAYKHWAILLESGSDTLAQYTEELKNSDGTAQRMADTMVDNLAGSLLMLRSALEGVAIQLSDLVKDDLRAVVEYLTKMTGKFGELSDGNKKLVITLGLVAASIGPLMIGASILITSFINVRSAIIATNTAFKSLTIVQLLATKIMGIYRAAALAYALSGGGVAGITAVITGAFSALNAVILANPFVFAAAALVALGGAFYFAYKKSETFRNVVNATFLKVKEVVIGAVNYISDIAPQMWNGLIEGIREVGEKITGFLGAGLMGGVRGVISGFIDSFKVGMSSLTGIISMLAPTLVTLGLSFLGVSGPIGWIIGAVVSLGAFLFRLSKTNDGVASAMVGAWGALRSAFEPILKVFADGFSQFAEEVGPQLEKTIRVITSSFAELGPAFAQVGASLVGLSSVIISAFAETLPVVLSVGMAIFNVFQVVFPAIVSIVGAVLPVIAVLLTTVINTILELVQIAVPMILTVIQAVLPAVLAIIQAIIPIIAAVLQVLVAVINGVVIPAINAILAVVQIVFPYIQMIIENALAIINGIIQTAMALLQGDWSGAWNAIKVTAETIMNNIISFFQGINLYDVGVAIINGLINGIKSMGSAIGGAIKGLIPEPLQAAASKVLGAIPGFAKGGVIAAPTLALVGEGGDTEAIIPWNNSQRSRDLWMQTGQQLGMLGSSNLMQTQTNDNQISPLAVTKQQFSSAKTNNQNTVSQQISFAPVYHIDGGNPQEVQRVIEQSNDNLIARVEEWRQNERRLAF